MSTAYVNCNRPSGQIEEKIYIDPDEDVDNTVQQLVRKDDQFLKDNLKMFIGNFPNTYTFTKNLAEKHILKNKGNVRCVIVRPSIIASSLEQPYRGWTDSISAAGGISIVGLIGLINNYYIPKPNILDLIPVDIVSNMILVTTAYHGSGHGKEELPVYQSTTGTQNSITVEGYMDLGRDIFKYVEFHGKVFKPYMVYHYRYLTQY